MAVVIALKISFQLSPGTYNIIVLIDGVVGRRGHSKGDAETSRLQVREIRRRVVRRE